MIVFIQTHSAYQTYTTLEFYLSLMFRSHTNVSPSKIKGVIKSLVAIHYHDTQIRHSDSTTTKKKKTRRERNYNDKSQG